MATHIQTRKAIETMRMRMTGLGGIGGNMVRRLMGGGMVPDDGPTQETIVATAERFRYA